VLIFFLNKVAPRSKEDWHVFFCFVLNTMMTSKKEMVMLDKQQKMLDKIKVFHRKRSTLILKKKKKNENFDCFFFPYQQKK
jgi:hypothetical protein